jgi:formylmethanofuran dehydrogenase subunit E
MTDTTPTEVEELLERCIAFHGHLCMGQVLGVRLALKGLELLQVADPKRLIVFIENDRCIADAIQIVTGTRFGRRTAKLRTYGKMAASFLDLESGTAWRVNVGQLPPMDPHDKSRVREVLHLPDTPLLQWLKPEELPGKPKRIVHCSRCGERVMDGRDVPGPDGPLCLSCQAPGYYRALEAGA